MRMTPAEPKTARPKSTTPPVRKTSEIPGRPQGTSSPLEVAELGRWSRQAPYGEALDMLKSAGNDWVAAKKAYAGRPGGPMRKLIVFREAYVDELLDAILAGYQGAERRAVGGTKETSDYDVTLKGGRGTWAAMKEFNTVFRSVWGKESGVVFDTNVYVGTIPKPESSQESWRERARATPEWQHAQEAASLSKIRRFMDTRGWNQYTTQVADGIMAPSPAAQRTSGTRFTQVMRARGAFSVAGAMYDAYTRSVARILASEGHTRRPAQSDDDFVHSMEHRDENAVMRARNILYAIHTRGVQDAERPYLEHGTSQQSQGAWRSPAGISELNSRSLLYAMEAYHSAGAVFDVVYGQQAKEIRDSDLILSDYVQSFNEQVGDTLKDLRHYEEDPGKAFYQSAKYVQRMTLAAGQILNRRNDTLDAEEHALLVRFRELSAEKGILLRLRGGEDAEFARMSEKEKSATAAACTEEILGTRSLRDFRRSLLQLAAAVHVLLYTQA